MKSTCPDVTKPALGPPRKFLYKPSLPLPRKLTTISSCQSTSTNVNSLAADDEHIISEIDETALSEQENNETTLFKEQADEEHIYEGINLTALSEPNSIDGSTTAQSTLQVPTTIISY